MKLYFALLMVFLLIFFGMKYFINYLINNKILDTPNERSNHQNPMPKGGGLLIIIAILIGCIISNTINIEMILLLLGSLFLSIIGFIDDRFNLSIVLRLVCQVFVTTIMIINIQNDDILIFQRYLPSYCIKFIIAIILIGFMNCFNFMDGIDGLASSEAIHISFNILILSSSFLLTQELKKLCLIITTANLTFLKWNWHKAKIFMGDSGSIPLGFILGWMLIKLALSGAIILSIIIPLYFLSDTLITMIKRLYDGEKIWQGHSRHFYQIAVRNGANHASVVMYIMIANIFLTIAAIVSLYNSILAIILAIITILTILYYLSTQKNFS